MIQVRCNGTEWIVAPASICTDVPKESGDGAEDYTATLMTSSFPARPPFLEEHLDAENFRIQAKDPSGSLLFCTQTTGHLRIL
jgi:hypothetical protein